MRMRKRKILYAAAVILSVLVIFFCAKETVMSRNKSGNKAEKQYFAAMETNYYADLAKLLGDKGYRNSGITIRWVSEEAGRRDYTVMIHHRNMKLLDETEKEELMRERAETEFQDERCTFHYEFLIF